MMECAEITLENALHATNALYLRKLSKPNVVELPVGMVKPQDLPLENMKENVKVKHMFDVIGEIDFLEAKRIEVTNACLENRFHDLPEPFCLKESPGMPIEYQLVALPMPNSKYFVLKHIIFPNLVKSEFMKSLTFGECHMVAWQGNAKNTKKALQYMLEKMGGFQVQGYTLQPASGANPEGKANFYTGLSEQDIDDGFDFIENHGPRTHHSNTQLRWISKQFISEDSPVKNWPERLIKEALRNLMNDGVLALPVHDFPLTLVDVEPGILDILEKFFPSFTEKALGMHGVPNVGKTPLGRTIAMAMSRYWVRKLQSNYTPGFREASEFDFFRGESGRQDRPDIFDDGSLPEQPMRKLKGFCDVGNTVLTKERWGAAKFPQGQLRIYMSNNLDLDAEPSGQPLVITHSDFMKMMEPAWMKGSVLSDVKAVLKRTCILIITNTTVYYRPATEQDVYVEGVRLDSSKSLLRQSGGLKYLAYRKGNRDLPEDFAKHLQWEEAWMRSVMDRSGPKPPMPVETRWTSPFGDGQPKLILQVSLGQGAADRPIKKEPSAFFRTLSATTGCIHLDSTPPRKSRKVATIKQENMNNMAKPINYGVIDLLSEGEGEDPLAAPMSSRPTVLPNPALEIEGVHAEMDEHDVFQFGGGLDGDE